ncbi:MAG: glycosyltransferase 61 family protein, partial [Propionibacteriaceae bacterium]
SLLVRNVRRVRPKLRDYEVNPLLERRPDLGRVVLTRPGSTLVSRCDYEENTSLLEYHPVDRFDDPNRLAVLKAPPLHLRVYSHPTCGRGQIVESQGLLLSDTFRHHPARRMVNVYVKDVADLFGDSRVPLGSPQPLPGAYFYFDSEWPGHFGHTMTEQISRLWAYGRAKEVEPDLKLLTSLPRSRPEQQLQDWELALLEPYGIGRDDVVVFDQAVRPERLYAATPMFSCPYYVHEQITETWDLIGRSLATHSTAADRPRRIFCSRRTSLKRACRNAPEVEERFVEHGFTVVYPEDYSLAEQAAMFRAAEVVGGFAGSGLFTMAFCETPKTFIMIGPESYTARNEYMFASVRGHRLRAVWSRPDIEHPEGRWIAAAFGSSFVVDFEREGRYLLEVLRSLPA